MGGRGGPGVGQGHVYHEDIGQHTGETMANEGKRRGRACLKGKESLVRKVGS